MNVQVLTAKKWTDIGSGDGVDNGADNCPACEESNNNCNKCFIGKVTKCVNGSFYFEWRKHQREAHGIEDFPLKAECPECRKIALEYAAWIMSLPFEDEKPKWDYPCHGITDHGKIVEFTAHNEGTLIIKGDSGHDVGHFGRNWVMDLYTPCDKPPEETFAVGNTVRCKGWPGLYEIHVVNEDGIALIHMNEDNTLNSLRAVKDSLNITLSELGVESATKLKGKWTFEEEK